MKSKADYDQSGIYGDDPTYKFNQEELSLRGESLFNLFDNAWDQKVGVSFIRNIRKYKYDETINNFSASTSFYDGLKLKIDWQNNLSIIENNLISLGVDFEIDETVSEFNSSSAFGEFYKSLSEK